MDARLGLAQQGDLADLELGGVDLLAEQGLATAVLLSLFTDRRAEDADLEDRRGWWASNTFGSQLWRLEREKATNQTAERARAYALEALEWLRTERIVDEVRVVAAYETRTLLGLTVTLVRGRSRGWAAAWDGFVGETYEARDVVLHLGAA